MGQKIHPTGFRLAVTRNWGSRWYAGNSNFADMLKEDLSVRAFLKKKLKNASVGRVLIERPAKNARITIFSSRPGVVIGKKGEDIEVLKSSLAKMMGVPVHVNIEEIRKPETDAQLIADSIAQQLEKRIMFRRAKSPAAETTSDDERKRRAPRRDDGKPAGRTARTKRADAPATATEGAAAPAPAVAKRVRAKKADAPAAPAEKAGE